MNCNQNVDFVFTQTPLNNCCYSEKPVDINIRNTHHNMQYYETLNYHQNEINGDNFGFTGYNGMYGVKTGGVVANHYNLPCQSFQNWDYNQCYNYYADGCYNSCQFVNMVDMEDFMNNEKRKEKSRDAARSRRSHETEIFTDLSMALPLPQEQVSQLDKASVMRLVISYLRVRDMIKLVPEVQCEKNEITADESVFLKSMDGFVLVISSEGDFIYISENVSDYLGISQLNLMGQNVYEYSHPCDHDEIKDILSAKSQEKSDLPKSFFLRLKCTLTSKGRSVNLKSATYKVIHCTGHILHDLEDSKNSNGSARCLVAIGQPIPHPSNIEAPLPRQTFMTKHGLDMKFTYADEKMLDFLGYESEDLIGKSVYEYHHATDSNAIASSYKCLFSKGQCETNRYRFLAKTGGYVWVMTQATLIYDKLQKPQSVVCVNYIISGIECKDEIYASFQLSSIKSEYNSPSPVEVHESIVLDDNLNEVDEVAEAKCRPLTVTAKIFAQSEPNNNIIDSVNNLRPQTATSKIFAPRTEDMSKGFLTFSEDEPGLTLLKDEPDDLTHLAPVAGDVVPLDHPFLSEMLDDYLMRDAFCPLLDEPTDPFISYRDSCDPSPQLLSPNDSFLKSSDCSLPSLNSPSDSLVDEDQMSTFMTIQMEDDPELIMKAPYIPMNMGDDLPLLMPDELMWSTNDRIKNNSTPENTSSLAQLLSSSVNKHSIKSNDHGGTIIQNTTINDFYEKGHQSLSIKLGQDLPQERISKQQSNKRLHASDNFISNKRTKSEPKEMTSELLQQLMSNNPNRGRSKGKSNWLLDSGGQKAACISQPSDSVLMNLLDDSSIPQKFEPDRPSQHLHVIIRNQGILQEKNQNIPKLLKRGLSLLNPEPSGILPSLMDLTQQDYEVNAPVNNFLLQGEDLISALEVNGTI